jgi:hypothetical protein
LEELLAVQGAFSEMLELLCVRPGDHRKVFAELKALIRVRFVIFSLDLVPNPLAEPLSDESPNLDSYGATLAGATSGEAAATGLANFAGSMATLGCKSSRLNMDCPSVQVKRH